MSAKIKVEIRKSTTPQDRLEESDLESGHFHAVLVASATQTAALKTYIKEIQAGTDTSGVETAIDAL